MTTSTRSQTIVLRSIVESKVGAAVKVHRIELTQAGTSMLTTAANGIAQLVPHGDKSATSPAVHRERVRG